MQNAVIILLDLWNQPMDGVGATIKNAIDNVAVSLESMTDVSMATSTNVIPLLHLSNAIIAEYSNNDVNIFKAKIPKHSVGRTLELQKSTRCSWKKQCPTGFNGRKCLLIPVSVEQCL